MPIIRIDYDSEQIQKNEVLLVSNAVREIVSKVTGIDDVFVYMNSSEITLKAAPVEIFIEMSAHKIKDANALLQEIKAHISTWKASNKFDTPLNLTLIPMPWVIEIGI